MKRSIGIDFGTTNSALAVADGNELNLAQFSFSGGITSTFRSILYFDPHHRDERGQIIAAAGPQAIDRYLMSAGGGRLVQSVKSYLASELQSTSVFGRTYSIEDLAALIVLELRRASEIQFGALGNCVVVGRPVRFAGAESPEAEELALSRLRNVFTQCGFDRVVFEYEPVGAAYYYESQLDHDEVVLIADFGGGTSDFCLIEVGPRSRKNRESGGGILGTEGVGLAGDAFDSEIVGHVVAPKLGSGSSYQSYLDKKIIPIPPWIFARLRKWHHLSFLNSRETMRFLREVHSQALEPEKIEGLIHLVEHDLGYYLYQAVEKSKRTLSTALVANFEYTDMPIDIREDISRHAFEAWSSGLLNEVSQCVERLLEKASIKAEDIDRVFLTGGSSFVPAVRNIFVERFGSDRIRGGNELTSVAQGLALRSRDAF